MWCPRSPAKGRSCFDNLFSELRHGGHFVLFLRGTLMVAILHWFSSKLQTWKKLSSAVCYRKSARLVGNFCKHGGPCFKKIQNSNRNQNFLNKASKVFIDSLITNLLIFCRLVQLFLIKVEKCQKLKKVKWLYILTLPWAILFNLILDFQFWGVTSSRSFLKLPFYIQSFQDWICFPGRSLSVRACVCLSVCLWSTLISTILTGFLETWTTYS